jgi:hypothetical protein
MASAAEPKAYEIEMIVFANEGADMAGGMPAQPLTDVREAVKLSQASEDPGFERLSNSQLTLSTASSLLEGSGAYEVIEHLAWRQPALNEDDAKPVHVHGGVSYQSALQTPAQAELGHQDSLYTDTQTPTTLEQLDGTVTVALKRYFHFYTDLVLRKPASEEFYGEDQSSPMQDVLNQFRIRDQQRMRRRELNYLDHPLLGILVYITPVAKEGRDEPE